jgi:hypothetical protein
MVDDVVLGCAMPEGEQGLNVARLAAILGGLPVETSAMTINRFCSSGLQAIAQLRRRTFRSWRDAIAFAPIPARKQRTLHAAMSSLGSREQ